MHLTGDKSCNCKFLYSNKTTDDILLEDELDKIDAEMPNISVSHTITRQSAAEIASKGKKYNTGRVTLQMLKDLGFPEPGQMTLIVFCGPRDFNDAMQDMLEDAGYTQGMLYR